MTTQQTQLKASISIALTEGKPWPTKLGHQLARLNRQRPQHPKAPTPLPASKKQKPPLASEASS